MSARMLWVTGPPFGPRLFEAAAQRVRERAPDLEVELVAAPTLGPTWREAGQTLAARLGPGDVLLAHGFAVPAALEAGRLAAPSALVLVNGPLSAADPTLTAVRRLGGVPGAGRLLPSAAWYAWLRSSVGLRRVVNNPYVMDHDTVAAVCDLADAGGRPADLLAWLGAAVGPWPAPAGPVTLLWGDNDRLFPLSRVDAGAAGLPGAAVVGVPGGRWAWPLEMPWAFADAVLALRGGGTTTSASHRAGGRPAGGGGVSMSSEEEAGLV